MAAWDNVLRQVTACEVRADRGRPRRSRRHVTGTAVDPYGNTRVGLEGKTTVNRKDWGVSWNAALEAGGVLLGEKVTLEFEVSAILANAA